jgi:uncharacterized cupredoxin-like copper-binding protein
MKHAIITGGLALALAACVAGESKEQQHSASAITAGAMNEITVRTRDYVFYDMPDTVPAGATNIKLVNDGPDLHHVWLVRLEEGKTLADLLEAMQTSHGSLPAWAVDVGGPNTPLPGEVSVAALDLEAGNYAVICVIPARDGRPHVMKGMVRALTVVPNKSAGLLPQADIVLTLNDYSFDFDKPVKAGRRTIRVENAAQQSHEAVLIQLAPGKNVHEMLAWLEKPEGPPPGKPIGGTTGIAQGEVNLITYDFTAGNYGLICFVPDAKDGKPHIAHGMVKEFTVTD